MQEDLAVMWQRAHSIDKPPARGVTGFDGTWICRGLQCKCSECILLVMMYIKASCRAVCLPGVTFLSDGKPTILYDILPLLYLHQNAY